MAQSKFTKHFQNNLASYLQAYLYSKVPLRHLEVHPEYHLKFGGQKESITKIDLAIIDPSSKGHQKAQQPEKMVAIEIEIFNNPLQIYKNYSSFRNYIRGGGTRVGGMMMLVSEWANINELKFNKLVESKQNDELTVNGFKGHFHDLNIVDLRATDGEALKVINSVSFKRKLKELIIHTHGINYK